MNTGKITRYILGLVLTLAVIFFCWKFFYIIAFILLAVAMSFIGKPMVNLLGKIRIGKWKMSNSMKAAIALLSIWLFFILFLSLIIPLVYSEFESLRHFDSEVFLKNFDSSLLSAESFLKNFGILDSDFDIKSSVMMAANSVFSLTGIADVLTYLAGALSNVLLGAFAVSFIAFFFLKDSCLFTRMLLTLIPERYEDKLKSTLDSCEHLLVRYFVGILIEMLIVMSLNTVGLLIVGLPIRHCLVIALITGIMVLIPYIGPLIGMLLGLSIAVVANMNTMDFMEELLPMLIYMEIVFLLTEWIDGMFFQPYIYGNSVHAHPLEIFLILLIAGNVAGIPGMMFAIPSYTIVRVILVEFFSQYEIVKKFTKNMKQNMENDRK